MHLVDDYIVKEEYGAKWLKIFDHNSTGGVFFNSSEEVLFSLNESKYSIIKYLPKIVKYDDNFYEFMLEYPALKGMNRWKQSMSPLNVKYGTEEYKKIIYEAINITWDGDGYFGSLVKTTQSSALFSAIKAPLWYFAIGAYTYWWSADSFPGASSYSESSGVGTKFVVKRAVLWIRVPQFSMMFKSMCSCSRNNYGNILLCVCVLFIS